MAFRFRLQTVLKHRERIEREAKRALGRLHQERETLEEKRAEFIKQRRESLADLAAQVTEGATAAKLLLLEKYRIRLERDIARKLKEINAAQVRIDAQLAVVETKMKERKSVEKLRDRRKEEYKVEERRRETKQIDDIVAQKVARRIQDPD